MNCFNGAFVSQAFETILDNMRKEISTLTAEKMDKTDKEAWVDYFVSRYEIAPIEIHPETMNIDLQEKEIAVYNQWHMLTGRAHEYVMRPGFRATCVVEYAGDYELFGLTPSTFSLSVTYDVDRLDKPNKNGIGFLHFSYEMRQDAATGDAIRSHFDEKIRDFMECASRINTDVKKFNMNLRSSVESEIDKRIGQLDNFASLRQSLNLPLKRVKDAPMAKPIVLPKKKIKFSEPTPSNKEQPYSISDADYQNITNIIDSCCSMMEAAPKSYIGFEEEQLRDHILSVLNTHYVNVSGETFRNNGKTDIYIPCSGDHAAYIAECKCWHGPKAFLKAIDQLFSYTTWRDTKVSVIVFNKKVKGFERVLSAIDETLNGNSVSTTRPKHSQWTCKVQNERDERVVHVTVQVFNLYSA